MNTKEYLTILSKGERDYSQSTHNSLIEKRAEYLEQYAEVDRQILVKQQAAEHAMPFVDSLRRKVATLVDAPDESLPIVTRFDLYTGIRGISERAPKDAGLKRLASQLQHTWDQEPLGSLTYGQVSALVRSLRDNFPRSAAADAVEAECARVGMHKLPVAKLARIASKIDSQEDYNSVIQANGLGDNKLEHIRARTFIRSIVAMRSESATDVVVNKLLEKNAQYEGGDSAGLQEQISEAIRLSEELDGILSDAAEEAFVSNMEDVGQQITDLQVKIQDWNNELNEVGSSSLPRGEEYDISDAGIKSPEHIDNTIKKSPEELNKDWSESPISDEAMEEAINKTDTPNSGKAPAQAPSKKLPQDLGDPKDDVEKMKKMRRSPLDPRTWFASKGADTIRLAKSAAIAADLFENAEVAQSLLKFSNILATITGQLAPIPSGKPQLPPDQLDDDMLLGGPDVDGVPPPGLDGAPEQMPGVGDGNISQPELDTGVGILEEIDDAAEEIVQEAPPQAMDYIQHEVEEGHGAPPGTAEWGAEEILNEGHKFAPPTEGWLNEEEGELGLQSKTPMPGAPVGPGKIHSNMEVSAKAPPGMEDTVMKLKKEYPGEPEKAFATAWSTYNKQGGVEVDVEIDDKESCDGKGIPLPRGKIKQQPKVTTYAKGVGSNGGATLKAADIETKLLNGKKLRVGQVSIHINTDDEVELWEKDAGRACSIMDLDVAIEDFMLMTGMKTAQAVPEAIYSRAPNKFREQLYQRYLSEVPEAERSGDGWLEYLNAFGAEEEVTEDGYTEDMLHPQMPRTSQIDGQDIPEADSADVTDVHRDVWPEQDIKLQIQQLKQQGIPDQEIPSHLMEMGVLGFQEIRPEDTAYLQQMVKSAQTGGQAYALDINYKRGNSFQETNQVRQSFLSVLSKLTPNMKIEDEQTGHMNVTIWGINSGDIDRVASKIQSIGGQVEFKRVGQVAPSPAPAAPSAAPPGAGAPPPSDGLSTPLSEIISAGMTHYKQMGMSYGAAVSQLRKDYKEREAEIDSPEGGMLLLSIGTELWTGGGAGPAAGGPAAEPAMPPSQPVMPMSAAAKDAQSKMKTPSIRKPKDHISVPKKPGSESDEDKSIPTPGSIKSQPNKGNHGKMSPKSLGKDSEGDDLLPSPGEITVTHDPKSQPGTKLPNKKLDPDLECKVPFKTPSLKSVPSVKK
jgi:hypothetical protein